MNELELDFKKLVDESLKLRGRDDVKITNINIARGKVGGEDCYSVIAKAISDTEKEYMYCNIFTNQQIDDENYMVSTMITGLLKLM